MATNADDAVTDEDLKNLKYGKDGVEDSNESDEPTDADDDTTQDDAETQDFEDESQEESEETGEEEEEEQSDDPAFTKKFQNIKGDTPEEYAKNLELAYENSTAEYHKLRDQYITPKKEDDESETTEQQDIVTTFVKSELDKRIQADYAAFKKDYSQVDDPVQYDAFIKTVGQFRDVIMTSEQRLPEPAELYTKAAAALGWQKQEPLDKNDKVAMAVRDGAAMSKTGGTSAKPTPKSKVTPQHIAAYRAVNPSDSRSDADIRKELEPHINN